ncbi:MAG: hypothetical protein RLZ55_879, partial [Actinomycetota bacterium]
MRNRSGKQTLSEKGFPVDHAHAQDFPAVGLICVG